MPERTVPTDADGVEDRFPGRESPTTIYNRLRCPICGVMWVREIPNPEDPDGPKLVVQEHSRFSPDCVGRFSPRETLFDTGPERKGAYSS
jgi:hypothetical protein